MSKIKLAAVVGPTAGGKTDLAIGLANAFDGEVVSCDSMQIYDFAPIATASPTADELSRAPHHLVGILKAGDSFSVSKYAKLAHETIKEIHGRGKLPLLTGGTGLYYSTVVDNINFLDDGFDAEHHGSGEESDGGEDGAVRERRAWRRVQGVRGRACGRADHGTAEGGEGTPAGVREEAPGKER